MSKRERLKNYEKEERKRRYGVFRVEFGIADRIGSFKNNGREGEMIDRETRDDVTKEDSNLVLAFRAAAIWLLTPMVGLGVVSYGVSNRVLDTKSSLKV
nr:hypothetical protein Iba_scaffold11988CG0010 [Ipomoea batatas]